MMHQTRIKPQARIIEEYTSIDLADVDLCSVSGCEITHCALQVMWNAQIPREMIERAHGQNPQGNLGSDQHGGDRIDRAVAATGNHHSRLVTQCATRQFDNILPLAGNQ